MALDELKTLGCCVGVMLLNLTFLRYVEISHYIESHHRCTKGFREHNRGDRSEVDPEKATKCVLLGGFVYINGCFFLLCLVPGEDVS